MAKLGPTNSFKRRFELETSWNSDCCCWLNEKLAPNANANWTARSWFIWAGRFLAELIERRTKADCRRPAIFNFIAGRSRRRSQLVDRVQMGSFIEFHQLTTTSKLDGKVDCWLAAEFQQAFRRLIQLAWVYINDCSVIASSSKLIQLNDMIRLAWSLLI